MPRRAGRAHAEPQFKIKQKKLFPCIFPGQNDVSIVQLARLFPVLYKKQTYTLWAIHPPIPALSACLRNGSKATAHADYALKHKYLQALHDPGTDRLQPGTRAMHVKAKCFTWWQKQKKFGNKTFIRENIPTFLASFARFNISLHAKFIELSTAVPHHTPATTHGSGKAQGRRHEPEHTT